jgi:hypothetical protein
MPTLVLPGIFGGGGVNLGVLGSVLSNCSISLQGVAVTNNTSAGGHGGGIMFITSANNLTPTSCGQPPSFWNYTYDTRVTMRDCVVTNNNASCLLCSGGGVAVASGAILSTHNTRYSGFSARHSPDCLTQVLG